MGLVEGWWTGGLVGRGLGDLEVSWSGRIWGEWSMGDGW